MDLTCVTTSWMDIRNTSWMEDLSLRVERYLRCSESQKIRAWKKERKWNHITISDLNFEIGLSSRCLNVKFQISIKDFSRSLIKEVSYWTFHNKTQQPESWKLEERLDKNTYSDPLFFEKK